MWQSIGVKQERRKPFIQLLRDDEANLPVDARRSARPPTEGTLSKRPTRKPASRSLHAGIHAKKVGLGDGARAMQVIIDFRIVARETREKKGPPGKKGDKRRTRGAKTAKHEKPENPSA